MKTLYADTHVWNQLCDQMVDPRTLLTRLAAKGVVPLLGFHDVYELAKTFRSGNKNERGRKLFRYLRGYLDLAIPIVVDTGMLLRYEASKVTGDGPRKCFLDADSYTEVLQDVENLSRGVVETHVAEFIEQRRKNANANRLGLKKYLAARPSRIAKLKTVSETELPAYLVSEIEGPAAPLRLQVQLEHVFPRNRPDQLARPAKLLIASAIGKVSRALVRAHIYLRWRCATTGSLRDDIYDDVLHVVNAAHCDHFVTTELRQADYVRLIVPGVSVIFADRNERILDRLAAGIA